MSARRVVYKFRLTCKLYPGQPFLLAMPKGAEVLWFSLQDGEPTFWARVAFDEPAVFDQIECAALKVAREFVARWTGDSYVEEITETHVGSWQDARGLVWHLFDRGER